jgi:hypothetical protein
MTAAPQPRDPNYHTRVCDAFARQNFLALIGARIVSVAPGRSKSNCRSGVNWNNSTASPMPALPGRLPIARQGLLHKA